MTVNPLSWPQARSAFTFAQPPDQAEITQLAQVVNDKDLNAFPRHKPGLLVPDDKDSLTAQVGRWLEATELFFVVVVERDHAPPQGLSSH